MKKAPANKKYTITTLLLTTVFFLSSHNFVFAVSPTVSPAPTVTKQDKLIDEINTLKEKVASKVAELQLVEKRGIIGMVTDVTGNKITLQDSNSNTKIVDVDELTKFSSPGVKGTFGISDISKGTVMSVTGLYNKQSKRILARFINTTTLPVYLSGVITDIDKANYTITIINEKQIKTIIDIENITKTQTYTEADGLQRIGFSKLKVDERVYAAGFMDEKQKNRMTGSRIIIFPELPNNPKIKITQESSSDSAINPASKSAR